MSLSSIARHPIALLLLFLASCSSGSTATSGVGARADAAVDVEGPSDLSGLSGDAAADQADVATTELPAASCPGGARCPCTSHGDCDGGICLETSGGHICAAACSGESGCTEVETCTAYATSGGDFVTVCVPRWVTLCAPCRSDAECQAAVGSGNPACYDGGAAGSFCSAPCGAKITCPNGFSCEGTPPRCVPAAGECPCSAWAVAHARATDCTRSNGVGTCKAVRTCAQPGPLPACSAAQASPETCNGADDDCDGLTDNGADAACSDSDPCTQDFCEGGGCKHASAVVCGDGVCMDKCGEAPASCSVDCHVCGDGSCSPGEGPQACPQDCCGSCGDGKCTGYSCGEDNAKNAAYCPADCGTACGNKVCDKGESPSTCATDCATQVCGNHVCEVSDGGPTACPQDCGNACGNCTCDKGETFDTCPTDCGFCGDGTCSLCDALGETAKTCPSDCGDLKLIGCTLAWGLFCKDGSPCTDDLCQPGKGCTHLANSAACDDGNVCTLADECTQGSCVGTPNPCDDGNPCTNDLCDLATGCQHKLAPSNACKPTIAVTWPPRAATLDGAAQVELAGTVTDAAASIIALTLNGSPLDVDPTGAFVGQMLAVPGANVMVLEATDALGQKKKHVQSFLWSTQWHKPVWGDHDQGILEPGLAYRLGPAVLDDGVHTLPANDMATVMEQSLQGIDFFAALPNPVATVAGIKIVPTKATLGSPIVTLTPGDGVLHMSAVFKNLSVDLTASQFVVILLTASVHATADSFTYTVDLLPGVDATHAATMTAVNATAAIQGMSVTGTDMLGNVAAGYAPSYTPTITQAAQQAAGPYIETFVVPTAATALNALAWKLQQQVPKPDGSGATLPIDLYNDVSAVTVTPDALTVWLRPRIAGKPAIAYENLGIPDRQGCGVTEQKVVTLGEKPLEMAIADDAFNELLYALWQAGQLEFEVPDAMLAGFDAAKYGITNLKLVVSGMVAPTISDCAGGTLLAQVGDFRIQASLQMNGQPMNATVYASFGAGTSVTAADGQVSLGFSGLKAIELQVDVAQDALVGNEIVFETLVKSYMLPSLLVKLGGKSLGAFPVPGLDLSGLTKSAPGTQVLDFAIEGWQRAAGNSVVQGHVK